jgi:hypothetical protein
MVTAAVWLGERLGMVVLSIGREALARRDSCTLVATGKWLAFHITLDGGWIWLSAQLMDQGDEPAALLTVGDGSQGWRTICRLIAALERNKIKTLGPRPLEIQDGPGGINTWVIG